MPSINNLTAEQVTIAINQIISSEEFQTKNQHITQEEMYRLQQTPRQWPEKPVFHPYKPSHDGYGQGKFSTKELVSSVTLATVAYALL
jgi:hypothetical protein